MMEMVLLRPMQAQDTAAVAALERACFSAPWSEASIAGELSNPLSRWLVAERDGEILGYVGSQMVPPEADVMNLAVAEPARGQGLGRALMAALMAALADEGIRELSLEVRASNAPALALYGALGFQEAGRRKNYYRSPMEDALILKRKLERE